MEIIVIIIDSKLHDFGWVAILKADLNKNDLAKFIPISDAFTTEILKIWSEISYDDNITSTENLLLYLSDKIHLCEFEINLLQIMVFQRNKKRQAFYERRRKLAIFH